MGVAEVAILLTVGGYLAVMLAVFCLVPAIQAKRRGYSFFVWFFAGLVALNPIILLIVLASIPHRKRQSIRDQFRRELDAKLGVAGAPTVLPVGRAAAERSLGDQPTVMPDARSLGDESTRL